MLSTILKSKTAIGVSIRIMDAFVTMRHYISDNLIEQKFINNMVLEHDSEIKLLQESFDKLEEKRKNHEIYFDGQIYDAYSKILDIFKSAKKELIIIDVYADNAILDMIKRLDANVTIITMKDNLLTNQDIMKYNKQYHNLKVIFNGSFHDRYFILDKTIVYHCGTSINRIGNKTFSINLISDEYVCTSLINSVDKITTL
jgi:sugar-specific transcriptional regulator TrmB